MALFIRHGTKKRWRVVNKEIVFGNGIIPYTDNYSGNGIIPILNHLLTEKAAHTNNINAKSIAQELQKVGVLNYYCLFGYKYGLFVYLYRNL